MPKKDTAVLSNRIDKKLMEKFKKKVGEQGYKIKSVLENLICSYVENPHIK